MLQNIARRIWLSIGKRLEIFLDIFSSIWMLYYKCDNKSGFSLDAMCLPEVKVFNPEFAGQSV